MMILINVVSSLNVNHHRLNCPRIVPASNISTVAMLILSILENEEREVLASIGTVIHGATVGLWHGI
jgi:hypothetical protein